MNSSVRRVLKRYNCPHCKNIESQLVNPSQFRVNCSNCGKNLLEISENQYKLYKKKNIIKKKEEPIRANVNVFNSNNISSVYQRPPSNQRKKKENQNNINIIREDRNNENNNSRYGNWERNNYNRESRERNRDGYRRYQSNNHYSNNNYNANNPFYNIQNAYGQNLNNFNNNYNNNYSNNYNNNNNYNYYDNNYNNDNYNNNNIRNNENNYENSRLNNFHINNNNRDARHRDRSQNPHGSLAIQNIFNNFFNGIFSDFNMPMIIFRNNNNEGNMVGRIIPISLHVHRHNMNDDIFDPIFLSFGSTLNNDFRDNFSSNFRSNFRGNFLNVLIDLIRRNMEESQRNKHPPTDKKTLNKLKKFAMTEKYCKKNDKGKIEYPNCCICLNDVKKGEKTVLLPCGHMFHWKCCLTWLETNNTCPVCRFELKEEK